MPSTFDYEELISDMLDISDEQREEDPEIVSRSFAAKFGIDMEEAIPFTEELLNHVPIIHAGFNCDKRFKAFVAKDRPIMLFKKQID